jgi:O-methyltransferase domain/Dimerisation domain
MPDDGAAAAGSPSQQVARLMDGYLTTQLLYVAAKLDLAEALADGPRDAEALAGSVAARPDMLRRVLRGLAAEGILDEWPDGRFGLTALGACLRSDAPGSQRGAIIARGDVYYGAAAGLLAAVRHGGAAFERVHGRSFFEYLGEHPELGATFQGSMADRSRQEAADVVSAYSFAGFEQLVDVGGGQGLLLEAILRAAPRSRGLLLDRPPVVERARQRLQAAGLAERCTFVPGDFFAAVPPGGDAYLLSRVIHDWDDESAMRILANCRAAMGERSTLLLVEAILPERAREQPAAIRMDLHMLTLLHGRERTTAEYERLLAAAGFRLARVVPTRSSAGVSVLEASPGPARGR